MGFYEKSLSKINRGGHWDMIVIDGVVGVGKNHPYEYNGRKRVYEL